MPLTTDPRYVRSRETILDAARELLVAHGPSAVTHARIAEHSGVARATIYRHWPRSDELLAEAMAAVPMPFFDAPTAPTRTWLRKELSALARQLEQPEVLAVTTTLAGGALWDPEVDERRRSFAQTLSTRLEVALRSAQDNREVTLAIDPRAAAAVLVGPRYYLGTIEHAEIGDDVVASLVAPVGDWHESG